MNDTIKTISDTILLMKGKLDDILDDDISYRNFGEEYGFIAAEYRKRDVSRKIADFITNLECCYDLYSDRHANKCVDELMVLIDEIFTLVGKIKILAQKGVESSDSYSKVRNSYIDLMGGFSERFDDIVCIINIKMDLLLLQNKTDSGSYSARYKSMAESSYKKIIDAEKYIGKVKSESERILEAAKRNIVDAGFKSAEGEFISKAKVHKKLELVWLSLSVLALIWMAFLVYKIVYSESANSDSDFSIYDLLKHTIQVFIPALLFSVAMKKYNAERNLNIIYSHRQIVLNQYQFFEAGLSDNVESKDKFRLEIARYIFSDPDTGYIAKGSSSSEININPVISTLDSVGKAISK